MKIAYTILTILFWITVVVAALVFTQQFLQQDGGGNIATTIGLLIGRIIGVSVLPALIFIIRYFVGKRLSK